MKINENDTMKVYENNEKLIRKEIGSDCVSIV